MKIISHPLRIIAVVLILSSFASNVSARRQVRGREMSEDSSVKETSAKLAQGGRRKVQGKPTRERKLDPGHGKGKGSTQYVTRPALPATVPVTRPALAAQPACCDIMETMNRKGGFQYFTLLLLTSGVASSLKTPQGPFTVFAPLNLSWENAQAVEDLVELTLGEDLKRLMNYHVVPGIYRSTDLRDGMTLTTVQGRTLNIKTTGGATVNNIPIREADITALNGVIHAIPNHMVLF